MLGRQRASDADFREFADACADALFRSALLLCGDRGRAEDLVQEALLSTYGAWPRIRHANRREAYARRCILNGWLSWNRKRSSAELPVDRMAESIIAEEEPRLEGRDVMSALGRLPPRQRAVIVLRYYEDLTEKQTARLLRCSVGTVKSQSSAALVKLRRDPALNTSRQPDDEREARR
jgi:RNA polymerase sigma-70 factor (sigma-E family)